MQLVKIRVLVPLVVVLLSDLISLAIGVWTTYWLWPEQVVGLAYPELSRIPGFDPGPSVRVLLVWCGLAAIAFFIALLAALARRAPHRRRTWVAGCAAVSSGFIAVQPVWTGLVLGTTMESIPFAHFPAVASSWMVVGGGVVLAVFGILLLAFSNRLRAAPV
jgi:hypothetical protein